MIFVLDSLCCSSPGVPASDGGGIEVEVGNFTVPERTRADCGFPMNVTDCPRTCCCLVSFPPTGRVNRPDPVHHAALNTITSGQVV